MQVLRLDMDEVKTVNFKHICGNMEHTRDFQEDTKLEVNVKGRGKYRSFPTLHAKTTVWVQFEIDNVETTSFWNGHFQESINKQSDMGLDAQAAWRLHGNRNGQGEEPCCAIHAFLTGRDDFMDFHKDEDEEEEE